jgi:hypothetical protein
MTIEPQSSGEKPDPPAQKPSGPQPEKSEVEEVELSPADRAAEAGWPTSERCTTSGLVVVEDAISVPKQHLISQVINRRFAPAGGLLAIDTWHTTRPKPYSPKAVGRYIDFVKVDSQATEHRWKEVEDHLPEALASVDRDEAVTDPRHIAKLRDCLTLHYARSLSTKIVHDRAWRDSRANRGASLRADEPLLAAAVQSRFNGLAVVDEGTGLIAPTALDWIAEDLLSGASTLYECGRLFRQSVERMYEQAKVWMASSALELSGARRTSSCSVTSPASP